MYSTFYFIKKNRIYACNSALRKFLKCKNFQQFETKIGSEMFMVRNNLSFVCRPCFDCRCETRRGYKLFDYWVKFDRWQDRVDKEDKEQKKEQLLRKWIPMRSKHFRPMYLTPEKEEDVISPKPHDEQTREDQGLWGYDGHARWHMIRYLDKSPSNMRRYHRYQVLLALQYDQRMIPERHLILGSDLAAAHFIVSRGGSIKFLDDNEWHKMDDKLDYILPAQRVEGLYVEAIDASKTELMFEGFGNLSNLKKLRFLSVADCTYMTDWCLGRMHQFENSLEFLDLSNCKRLSAKGLSSLACLKNLKYLRLEGLDYIEDIAKVALMLEENLPDLVIVGLDYAKVIESLEKTDRLLSHENVRQDAKGNIFLKDETGDFYYLKGCVPERSVVDEKNLPLMRNKIRKDVPAVPYEVAETLNELSDGKLKHLLTGSASGEWSQETERILRWEITLKLKNGEFIDPFLYPKSMKDKTDESLKLKNEMEKNALNSSPDKLLLQGTPG